MPDYSQFLSVKKAIVDASVSQTLGGTKRAKGLYSPNALSIGRFPPTLFSGKKVIISQLIRWLFTKKDSVRDWTSIASSRDGTKLIACISWGGLYISTDSGATWTSTNAGTNRDWKDVDISDDGQFMVAVSGITTNKIFYSSNSGSSWTDKSPSGYYYGYNTVSMSRDGTKIMAAQDIGPPVYSVNGGAFSSMTAGNSQWTASAVSSDFTKIAITVYKGFVRFSPDNGSTWSSKGQSTQNPLPDLAGTSSSWKSICMSDDGATMYIIPSSGYIYKTSDTGANWQALTSAGQRSWTSIKCSSDGAIVYACTAAGGTGSSVYVSKNGGTTWTDTNPVDTTLDWKALTCPSTGASCVACGSSTNMYLITE